MDISIYRPIPCSNCVAPQLNSFHISVEFISHFAAALGQPAKSLHTFAIPLRGKIGFLSATESNLCSLCKCATNDWLQEKLHNLFGQRIFLKQLLKIPWLLFHPVVFVVVCQSCDVESDTNMKRAPSSQTNEVGAKRNLQSWVDAWDRCFPEGLCQVGNVV